MSAFKPIPKNIVDEVKTKSNLLEVVLHFQENLKKQGRTSFKGRCNNCGSDHFTVTPAKDIIKCFSCEQGASGAIGYLTTFRGMKFTEAVEWLAERCHVSIVYDEDYIHESHASVPVPGSGSYSAFRDAQLRSSGIPDEAQSYDDGDGNTLNRYTAGTLDYKGNPVPGYDMLLHYLDLDGRVIMYRHERTKRDTPYIRIRHERPEHHLDKEGKPIRYASPYRAGNHIWIPEFLRRSKQNGTTIERLALIEGEKKADALCLAGIPAAGISGIHNFSIDNTMPEEMRTLLHTFGIKEVVFFFDSDFDDLGDKIPTPADNRPRTFCKAAIKFKNYFLEYANHGIYVRTFIAYGTDKRYKGMDDLLVALRDEAGMDHLPRLEDDLQQAINSHKKSGNHICVHEVTGAHDIQLREIWHIQNPAAFKQHYAERLKEVPEFKLGNMQYRYNSDKNEFEIAQALMPDEQFWKEVWVKGRKQLEFYYKGMKTFLSNKGFGQLQISEEVYQLVQRHNNIVAAVDTQKITRFVDDYVEALEDDNVEEMLLSGGDKYISRTRLARLPYIDLNLIKPQRDRQILPFPDCFWMVTPDRITEHDYSELSGDIWKDDIIPFKGPKVIKNFFTLKPPKDEDEGVEITSEVEDSDIIKFFIATSDILWRTADKKLPEYDPSPEAVKKRNDIMMASLADKIIATGYIVSDFMDPGLLKAVIPMDAVESKTGKSEGGTGKSLFARMFQHVMPMVVISGKRPRLTEDKHIYEEVTQRTRGIIIDDCRRNLDFEAFLTDITYGVFSEPKGLARRYVGPKRFIFPTNHTIKGNDRSFIRRQYNIAFGDYFNLDRTPFDVFKHSIFDEWDWKQWNYFYNFIAHCLQVFMRHGLKSYAPSADIQRRKWRAEIGEEMLPFFEDYFYNGSIYMNNRLELKEVLAELMKEVPKTRMWATPAHLRERLELYCHYSGFKFNPSREGKSDKRIRSGGKEFFVIANDDYAASLEKSGIKFGQVPETEKQDEDETKKDTPF